MLLMRIVQPMKLLVMMMVILRGSPASHAARIDLGVPVVAVNPDQFLAARCGRSVLLLLPRCLQLVLPALNGTNVYTLRVVVARSTTSTVPKPQLDFPERIPGFQSLGSVSVPGALAVYTVFASPLAACHLRIEDWFLGQAAATAPPNASRDSLAGDAGVPGLTPDRVSAFTNLSRHLGLCFDAATASFGETGSRDSANLTSSNLTSANLGASNLTSGNLSVLVTIAELLGLSAAQVDWLRGRFSTEVAGMPLCGDGGANPRGEGTPRARRAAPRPVRPAARDARQTGGQDGALVSTPPPQRPPQASETTGQLKSGGHREEGVSSKTTVSLADQTTRSPNRHQEHHRDTTVPADPNEAIGNSKLVKFFAGDTLPVSAKSPVSRVAPVSAVSPVSPGAPAFASSAMSPTRGGRPVPGEEATGWRLVMNPGRRPGGPRPTDVFRLGAEDCAEKRVAEPGNDVCNPWLNASEIYRVNVYVFAGGLAVAETGWSEPFRPQAKVSLSAPVSGRPLFVGRSGGMVVITVILMVELGLLLLGLVISLCVKR